MRAVFPLLLLLVAVPLVPAASADPVFVCAPATVAYACAYHYDAYGDGCSQEGSLGKRATGILVGALVVSAYAEGSDTCYNGCLPFIGCIDYADSGVSAQVVAAPLVTYAIVSGGWHSDNYTGCHTWVQTITAAGVTYRDVGCPAGSPPDLWALP